MHPHLRRFARIIADARTAGLTGAQIAAQVLFFFVVPRVLPIDLSAPVLLAYVYASALGQLTPFGVQYSLLRAFVQDDRQRIARLRVLLWLTLPLTVGATIAYPLLYTSETAVPPHLVGVLLVSFTTRAIASAVHQALNAFHKVQIGTILASASRTAAIVLAVESDPLVALAATESAIAIGWCLSTRTLWGKSARALPTGQDVRQSGAFFLSAISRVGLLDLDKLLFAVVATPDAFVTYTLVSRVYAGASSFANAYFARETPRVISASTRSELLRVTRGALPTALIGLAILAVATAAAAIVFTDLWLGFAISAALLGVALVANLANTPMLDFIFYNKSVMLRIGIQLGGMAIVVGGTVYGAGLIGAIAPAASVMLSGICTAGVLFAVSRRMFN